MTTRHEGQAGSACWRKMADWPHSPVHRLTEAGAYMLTGGTYLKRHHFQSSERLRLLCEALQRLAAKYGWNLQAWAVFSNHYYWVGLSPSDPTTLRTFVSELHTETSRALNEADRTPGRQVWFQYWETRLTYQRSYLARLSYMHRNAVHHCWFVNRHFTRGAPPHDSSGRRTRRSTRPS
jgi:putative transposase